MRWEVSALVRIALCLPVVLALPITAQAADASPADKVFSLPPASDGWIVSVGTSAEYSPRYSGAKKYSPGGMPSISFRRASEPEGFSAPDDGLDYTLFSTPNFSIGPVATLRSARTRHDGTRLTGLDSYPWTIEAGAFTEYWPSPDVLRTRIEFRHGLRGKDGFVANLSTDLVGHFGPWTLSGGPRLSLADMKVAQIEYGVTPLASARSGLFAPYRAHGGLESVGFASAQSYAWFPQWRTTLYEHYDYLTGSAAVSPNTKQIGTRHQFTAGLAVTYSFALSDVLG